MEASLNQGKSSYERKSSRSLARSHPPCVEIFVTSILEMLSPSGSKLILILLNDLLDLPKLATG